MNPILQRLYDLMAERGVNAKQVTETLHMSSSSFTDWKKGKASPGVEALSKMAPYFGVSLDYLITGHDYEPAEGTPPRETPPKEPESSNQKESSTPVEEELLAKYRRLPADYRGNVMAYLDGMLSVIALLPQTPAPPQRAAQPEPKPVSARPQSVIEKTLSEARIEEDGRKLA